MKPSEQSFGAVISACAAGHGATCLSLWTPLGSRCHVVNSRGALESFDSRAGSEWQRALLLFESLQDLSPDVDRIAWSAAVTACEPWKHVTCKCCTSCQPAWHKQGNRYNRGAMTHPQR